MTNYDEIYDKLDRLALFSIAEMFEKAKVTRDEAHELIGLFAEAVETYVDEVYDDREKGE